MSAIVDVDESATILSELLEWAEAGDDVVIARAGKPVVRLVRVEPSAGRRPGRGTAKGRMWIADNFDDPMPEIEAVFAGEA
jgi:antitoxin (DNA-binding transcriptional repressor) of toxin-antitoxin stability system